MQADELRVLVLGAHPDDAEFHAGGTITRLRSKQVVVKVVSVTDGRSGHHRIPPDEVVAIRRAEAAEAGKIWGAENVTWDFPDGALQPTLELRSAIIREIRRFAPQLVLTHRTCDYHPDHRAVGQAVQDASYMVTVPHVCSDTPALRNDPVVAYMCDLFSKPNRLSADIVMDVTVELETVVRVAACHRSQFFEWLPYHDGTLETVPADAKARFHWLKELWLKVNQQRKAHFAEAVNRLGLQECKLLEVFEISEYAGKATPELLGKLFG